MAFVAATAGRGAAAGAASRGAGTRAAGARRSAGARSAGAGTTAEQQREAIEQIKQDGAARRAAAEQEAAAAKPDDQLAETPATSSKKEPPVFRLQPPDAVGSGSGAVLGVLAWVVAVNYLRGGVPQVKQLLRAKFLNRVEAS